MALGPRSWARRLSHSALQVRITVVVEADEVRDDFRVRVRAELDALGLQLGAQFAEVLDDAVLHDHELAFCVRVRVRVALARLPVSRPAGVPDADVARDRVLLQAARQVAQLADVAADLDLAVADDRYSRGIVPAVFEPPQAFEDNLGSIARTYVSDYPTHGCPLLVLTR